MTGIDVKKATTYTGYVISIARNALPVWAKKYSRIGISAGYMKPFDVPVTGLSFNRSSILLYNHESAEGTLTLESPVAASKWYVLVALYDEDYKSIGYFTTSIDLVG